MANLTYGEIENYWIQAGGNAAAAPVAAAIAMAESGGGNPNAHNPIPPDDSYGLWQINMLGRLGPARQARYGLSSYDQLYDPLTNAKAAVDISSNGTNYSAWTTYTTGKYQKYLQNGGAPSGGASTGGTANATQAFDLINPLGIVGDLLQALYKIVTNIGPIADAISKYMDHIQTGIRDIFMVHFWARVGSVVAGIIALIFGLWLFIKGDRPHPIAATEKVVGTVAGTATNFIK